MLSSQTEKNVQKSCPLPLNRTTFQRHPENRKSGSFTGVTDVVNFDANEIILDTELGRLTIKGKELHVNRLDLQKKEVEIDGTVDMLQYSGTPGRGVFGKWFG